MRLRGSIIVALLAVGCSGDKKDTTDSGPLWTLDTGTTDTEDTQDPPDSGDSGDSGVPDANLSFTGIAQISTLDGTWVGSESAQFRTDLGTLMCQWTWQAQDWQHDPAVMDDPDPRAEPCTDDDGNPCDFAFSVTLTAGFATSGNCDVFAGTGHIDIDGGDYGYGYIANYYSGNTSYGEQFMYHALDLTGLETWIAAPYLGSGAASWDQASSSFDYELTKVLIEAYAP